MSKKVRKEAKKKLVEKKAEDKAEDKAGNACVAVMRVLVHTHAWGGTGSQPEQHRACGLTNTASACAAGMHVHAQLHDMARTQPELARQDTHTHMCMFALASLRSFVLFLVILRICRACTHVCLC